jgi:uncharacterized protein (TIGR02444 family)
MRTAQGMKPQDAAEFWRFSLSFYGDPEVAGACLALQDRAGADVNLVLFLLWRASRGRSLAAAEIGAVDEAVAGWRREVVVPLRGVRRWLKHHAGPVEPQVAQELRQQVKRIELEAERLQQQAIAAVAEGAALGAPAPSPRAAAEASLAAYAAARGLALPQALAEVLLDKLAAHEDARPAADSAGDGHGA